MEDHETKPRIKESSFPFRSIANVLLYLAVLLKSCSKFDLNLKLDTPLHCSSIIMSGEPSDLSKVDSAVSGLSSSPPDAKKGHRRASSSAAGVYNIADLGTLHDCRSCSRKTWVLTAYLEKEGKELTIAEETQHLNWYVTNQTLSPASGSLRTESSLNDVLD